ncbi:MAG: hypothetical protein AAFO94_12415, partial [Bacteroidota bacterium]
TERKVAQNTSLKQFNFRGSAFKMDQLSGKWEEVQKDISEHYDSWFKAFDEQVFYLHWQMMQQGNMEHQSLYRDRCQFQSFILMNFHTLQHVQNSFNEHLNQLFQKGELNATDVHDAEVKFNSCRNALEQMLQMANDEQIPPMEYIDSGNLRQFLLPEKLVNGGRNLLTDNWIQKFSGQLNTVVNRLRRLYFKNLGQIISLQETTERQWQN